MKVKIADIVIEDRKRPLNMKSVMELADSIKETGLLHPIALTPDNRLIAGRHRIEAFKVLGRDEIEAEIKSLDPLRAELAEIDENLIRTELHYLERGDHLKRRKQIYEILYPESKHGGDRKSDEFETKRNKFDLKPGFSKDTAAKTGFTPRTIQQDVQIATHLKPEIKKEIKDLDLPKNEALRLVRTSNSPEDQIAILEKIKERKARTVREAEKQVALEKEVERGKKLEVTLDADFKVGDYKEVLADIQSGSVGAIISSPPTGVDFHDLFEEAARLLKDEGTIVLMINQDELPRLFGTKLPEGLSYWWTLANLLEESKVKPEGISSSWLPVVVITKGMVKLEGRDSIQKGIEKLTRQEDSAIQLVSRFSDMKDLVVDPFVDGRLMTYVAACVGRKYMAISTNEQVVSVAKAKLEDIKDIIAAV